jgi:glyoxylase-like metal-dependent hydrolase (beta-lactamase superfamily II)
MVTELREGVWWINCTGVNAYLVDDGELTLVDTGTPFDTTRIEAAIETAGFAPSALDRILITHYDLDHVGSAAKLSTDAPIYVGRADAPLVTGEKRPALSGHKAFTQLVSGPLVLDVPADRVSSVEDGDEIGDFTAYHTPGHTPGHTVYLHDDHRAAFLGDMVIERGGDLQPSPWLLSYDT